MDDKTEAERQGASSGSLAGECESLTPSRGGRVWGSRQIVRGPGRDELSGTLLRPPRG